jgi:hypothetical protein
MLDLLKMVSSMQCGLAAAFAMNCMIGTMNGE